MTATAASSIFISYRRDDSAGHAGRLADRLAQRIGAERVFRDIEDIAAGEDFVARLERQLDECQVLLALIGPRWLAPGPGGRPRVFDDDDWVRREIVRAMDRGLRVIPVLLQGATMPGAESLPEDLSRLARLNAMELRETQFERDAEHLAAVVAPTAPGARTRRFAIAAVLVLVAVGVGLGTHAAWRLTPGGARHELQQRGLSLDDATFVERAARGDAQAVRLFLRARQSPEARDADDRTALARAVQGDHAEVVRLLLDAGAAPDPVLWLATQHAGAATFDLLMARGPGPEALGEALSTAAAIGNVERLQRLADAGARIDDDRRMVLRNAIENSQPDALRWLIERGARVDGPLDDGATPLLLASGASIQADDPAGARVTALVRLLLEAGADPNARRDAGGGLLSTPLLIAAYYDRVEVARALLEHRADPDLRSSEGSASTSLMVAAERDHVGMMTRLLDAGAKVDAVDTAGQTALMMAARLGQREAIDVLLARGANVDHQDAQGFSALMLAVRALDEQSVARLLDAGADVNLRSARGWTALMQLAARRILAEYPSAEDATVVARMLVDHGARRDLRDPLGQDAHALAEDNAAPPDLLAVLDAR